MTPRSRYYVTTTIPYVNSRPHLGFALELVQADVLARHRRQRGDRVRFLSGTDDNSLKNVLAAEAAGVPVQTLVDRNAAAFEALRGPLDISYDDFISTSRDPRHRVGVERLWRRCAQAGDLYRRHYEGLYCVGCEQFHAPTGGRRCPEHGTELQHVAEENWFFRLSRHAGPLRELITSGRLRIEPASRRNEVLALIDGGLRDFSVSRSHSRARGWGIPVPGDPGQVVSVWWDALGSYVTSLGYGTGTDDGTSDGTYDAWWGRGDDGRRVHLLGKGVLRFHAVYWPAILLSAGLPLPTDLLVHDYLTVGGAKISKSAGNAAAADPAALVEAYGTDAVRWWLLREVPRAGDADFTPRRLAARADADLAGGIGNLVHRVTTLLHRRCGGRVPDRAPAVLSGLGEVCHAVPGQVDAALEAYDVRRATGALWTIVDEANRALDHTRPWEPARSGGAGSVLAALHHACRVLGEELRPFLPGSAARITAQCTPVAGVLPEPQHLFGRVHTRPPHRV